MVLMVQGQMRRALREGMVELMRDALASPEPGSAAAAAAAAGCDGDAAGVDGAVPFVMDQQFEQESVIGSESSGGEGGSSSDGEAFVMVDAASSDGGSN
jgi:hypothetical protein